METLCLPYPKAECKGLVTFILQKFLRSAEFQWFNGWQLEVSPKNQQAIRLWCRVSTMNSWQSTCPRYHKRHMGTVEATQIFIIYEIYMVNSIHCYQQFTYGQGLSGFCLQAFISFASRHLDLGLCRTCWIGCIHPVNFQSWPLEESIFLGYFFGYLTMYMMWYKKLYVDFSWFFSFNHLESSIGHCSAASAQPRHHRWHTMVRHHKPATSIHTTADSFWASCLATEYTTGWNTQPQYLDINVEA